MQTTPITTHYYTLQHTVTHCNRPQRTAPNYNTLKQNATHCRGNHAVQHTTWHLCLGVLDIAIRANGDRGADTISEGGGRRGRGKGEVEEKKVRTERSKMGVEIRETQTRDTRLRVTNLQRLVTKCHDSKTHPLLECLHLFTHTQMRVVKFIERSSNVFLSTFRAFQWLSLLDVPTSWMAPSWTWQPSLVDVAASGMWQVHTVGMYQQEQRGSRSDLGTALIWGQQGSGGSKDLEAGAT